MEATIEPLNRVFLELGPFTIYWYGLIIATGAGLGLWLAVNEAKRQGLNPERIIDLVVWAVPIAIICARLYYVVFNLDFYIENPSKIIAIWEGGIAIHGALIGAVITAIVYCKKHKLAFWQVADIAAPSILLGQAIGRWGNFMNQEAFGEEVSRAYLEGLNLPDFIINQMYIDGAYHHPTFLYESIWNFIGVGILLLLRYRVKALQHGEIFLSYAVWYSIGRFFIEGLRTDSLMLTETLRMAQVISLITIVVAVAIAIYRRKRKDV